ncbi:hypothetical protein ARMGADRAFT_1025197 [Armillaria gallica]|uniref:Uncharacterized protein n=1 Tax=Armillaria gallica TaxID=47427 RepID=A0A2H3ERS5_ARMGA|nr:hypothetical protein ARMGADRAFT_1025197 [Armillaria gallica]
MAWRVRPLAMRQSQSLTAPSEPQPILDTMGTCIMVLGGHLNDPRWDAFISFGGGQICPGNLKNMKNNTAVMRTLISKPFFHRMAGFSDNTFGSFFLKMYEDYATILDGLCADNPHLHRNFIECMWVAATINFGPSAYTNRHTDFLNLVLGNFNAKKGRHLVV